MRPDDFFRERSNSEDPAWDMNGEPWAVTIMLNEELLEDLVREAPGDRDDLEVSIALAQLVHDELEAFGTDGGQRMQDAQMVLALRSLRAVLKRLGIAFEPPFRNFASFRSFWIRKDCAGSWQARRDLLDEMFGPLHLRLIRLEDTTLEALANPISPRAGTGWPVVDEEIRELRRRFQSSTTGQDYRAVGTHCVGVLMALSRTVYDPARHLREGESVPSPDKSKQRIGRYIEDTLAGKSYEDLRGLTNKAIEFAHHVKHADTPTRRDAGIAADTVILLANILRRLEQEF
jgi:hypothetical protein